MAPWLDWTLWSSRARGSVSGSALLQTPHRRWNLLRREWIVVSPHRTARPLQGQVESFAAPTAAGYDPACYLCPGNLRANGERTPDYQQTFVFENDFAALNPEAVRASIDLANGGLLKAETERGICRVLCFDPRHDLTLATMSLESIERVVDVWAEQAAEIGARPEIGYVQIFENRGAMMGASNPHPHGQVWATEHVPNEPLAEWQAQSEYSAEQGKPLLEQYLQLELTLRERLVRENDTWVALVPFWAVWPFETMLLPRQSVASFAALSQAQRGGLAAILKDLTAGYNRVFETRPATAMTIRSGRCTRTSIRRCCVPPRSGSLWWGLNCWVRRSATLRPSVQHKCCAALYCVAKTL